jgi:hypothetical protein
LPGRAFFKNLLWEKRLCYLIFLCRMAAALHIPIAEIMLTSETGDWVSCGAVFGVGCGLAESVPDTSVLLPATTFTDDCQSW